MRALALLLFFSAFNAHAELETVPYVDLSRYAGTWYQQARNPVFFENGCVCSRQVLTARDDGKVSVYNSCNKGSIDGPLDDIRGVATNEEPGLNAKFTVDFGLPFLGKYWIIGLDPDYRFAVVSEPSQRTLYVLSRTPELEGGLYEQAVALAARQTDVSRLQRTQQDGCRYPEAQ